MTFPQEMHCILNINHSQVFKKIFNKHKEIQDNLKNNGTRLEIDSLVLRVSLSMEDPEHMCLSCPWLTHRI